MSPMEAFRKAQSFTNWRAVSLILTADRCYLRGICDLSETTSGAPISALDLPCWHHISSRPTPT